ASGRPGEKGLALVSKAPWHLSAPCDLGAFDLSNYRWRADNGFENRNSQAVGRAPAPGGSAATPSRRATAPEGGAKPDGPANRIFTVRVSLSRLVRQSLVLGETSYPNSGEWRRK